MILSDLLGRDVLDDTGTKVGRVIDARFVLDGSPVSEASLAQARLLGFLVSPRSRNSYLGYERKGLKAPWPIGRLERWWHRGSFLVRWEDVAGIDEDAVRLRPGYTRHDTSLRQS
ncbi:PRC-barrel domain-containing protein [Arthrobacter sp. GCM10027362]|uniref:PRC-barrel domain-containing protein n=1 Tax=Arthrobacter sp. GCM10027362 TaxID=3273379 RepID=UPI0036436E9D